MSAWIAYRWRRWRTKSLLGHWEMPCRSYRCGRPTLMYSVWCRSHTDAILFDGVSPSAEHETPLFEPMTQVERSERWEARWSRR